MFDPLYNVNIAIHTTQKYTLKSKTQGVLKFDTHKEK